MSRFKSIRNKINKNSSMSIDEKLAALDKELQKTGISDIQEQPTMSVSNIYTKSQYVAPVEDIISPVPDGNGLVTGTWTQPVGTAFGGGAADAAPTSFPKFWNNAGYRTPVSGIVNTDNLNGDGAALPIAKMPDNGEPFETEVSPAARLAGAVGGFMKYNSGINAGWRTGYMTGGTRDSGGGTFTAYDGQTFGIKYPITHLGVSVNPTSHPHLFRAVQYWHPFSIFNPDIDARWPLGDVGPKYQGIVTEIDGVKYALFTAYKWIGGGGNTYISQHARPATTLLIQRQGIGDINYHGPITPGGMFGLSRQGYNYIDNRSRRGGAPRLIGQTTYRTRGGGVSPRGIGTGKRRITSISKQLIPYGRGGKVGSRGVGNYIRGRGAGFSPSAGRVAQNVAKELPPKPTPAEIRNETVKQFRDKGENLEANRFYTEDRISELEGKEKLTSSEQSELDQLKVYSVYIANADRTTTQPVAQQQADADEEINQQIKTNQNAFASAGYDPVTEFLSADESNLSPGDIAILKAAYEGDDSKVSEWTKKSSDSSTGDDSKVTQLPPPVEEPPKPSATEIASKEKYTFPDGKTGEVWTQRNGDKIILNDKREVVDPDGRTTNERQRLNWLGKQKNNLGIAAAVVSGSILPHQPLPGEIEQVKTSLKPSDFTGENGITITSEEIPYSDGNFYVTYDENGKKVFNDNRGDDGSQSAVQPDLSNPDIGGSTDASMLLYGKPNMQMVFPKDGSPPYLKMEKYAYHNLNSPESDELPDKGSEVASNIIHAAAETISAKVLRAIKNLILPDTKIPDFLSENGIKGMTHTEQKFAFDELPEDVQEQLKQSPEYKAWLDSKTKADAIDKYPPPKQSSIFTNEDGTPTKYYTKSIFTGRDGKTYKSVLILPYTGDNDDGSPRFGSLYHPGSYTTNIPLFDTPMDEPLGDYTPPDDLPDIPFTPPEPEPDNRKDYEKNRDRQRRFRNSYEPKGDILSEAAKLGHFEPEELNVDIEKLRKGIMPEFPKKSPKIIDGYHQDSKIKPKEPSKDVYLKLDPKDLIRNHRLKQKEADELMKTIDRINAHIKAHPEDLIHAQMRYPVDDPRLAELNYKMDMMLEAGEEYMDSNFKENKKLFKRATDRTKKNMKLTDPEYVQQNYDELRGTTKPKKTKLVGRLGKHLNKYESKSLFKHVNSRDFKKINEQKIERKEQVKQIQKEIEIEFQEKKNDWRKDLSNNTY